MHEKVGGQTTLIDPALEKVGGQLTPLTPCFRGLCVLQYVILQISHLKLSIQFHRQVAEMHVSVLLSIECQRLPNNDLTLQ